MGAAEAATWQGGMEYYVRVQLSIKESHVYHVRLAGGGQLGMGTGDSNYRIYRERGQGLQPFSYLYILLSPLPMKVCIYSWLTYTICLVYAMLRRRKVFYSAVLISSIWISNLFVAWYGSWGD